MADRSPAEEQSAVRTLQTPRRIRSQRDRRATVIQLSRRVHLQTDVAWWRHAVVRRRTHDQTNREFDTRLARDGSTTLGKLFTRVCLDADCLRYCTESLNRVPGYLHHLQTDVEAYTHTHTTATMLAAVLKAAAAVVFTQLLMDSR